MKNFLLQIIAATCAIASLAPAKGTAGISFLATQYDIGGTFYPTYSYPQNSIAPWRTDSEANFYSVTDEIDKRYYGRDGYALFATRFDFPNASSTPGNAFVNPNDNSTFPNLINLPSFVANSQIFSTRKAGGWAYALIDDPRLQAGPRLWTFDGTNYPPPVGGENTNITGVVPYVKLGILDGGDTLGNADAISQPAARWGFQVGSNVPSHFRVGVMTDGLDGVQHSPGEIFLTRLVGNSPVETVNSGIVARNRFIDMHFFDIVNAQPGDQFLFSAQAAEGGANAGVSGFSFDIIVPFQPIGADLDGNGLIDGNDIRIIQQNLGNAGGIGDLDNNGVVNNLDFNAVVAAFPPSATPTVGVIPEPVTAALLGSGLLGLSLLRRQRMPGSH